MQTVSLRVEESFYPHFQALISSLIRDKKVELVDDDFPQDLIVSSVEEVRRRVYESEKEPSISQDEYNSIMNNFFKNELDITR
jgi:hypothetical protein